MKIRVVKISDERIYSFSCYYKMRKNSFEYECSLYITGNEIINIKEKYNKYEDVEENYMFENIMKKGLDIFKKKILDEKLEQFKNEMNYKKMSKKRNLEFESYLKNDIKYIKLMNELEAVEEELDIRR